MRCSKEGDEHTQHLSFDLHRHQLVKSRSQRESLLIKIATFWQYIEQSAAEQVSSLQPTNLLWGPFLISNDKGSAAFFKIFLLAEEAAAE
jgi:hypothetical protein